MKTNKKPVDCLPAILALAITMLASPAFAQDSLIAIGRVFSGGGLTNSANTIGATISSSRPATGEYQVEINAPGAFAGNTDDDFIIHATVNTIASNDRALVALVDSITNDVLTIEVLVADVEDAADPDQPDPSNFSFYFAVHRVPTGTAISARSPYLLANGRISGAGAVTAALGTSGEEILVVPAGAGNYTMVIGKPGGFGDDALSDYVMLLTPWGSSVQDYIIAGGASNVVSDNSVTFRIRTNDAQSEANDNLAAAESRTFYYSIYRIPGGAGTPPIQSSLLLAAARIEGGTGNLTRGATSIPGASIASMHNGTGDYHVTINAPGRFSGSSTSDFTVQLLVNRPFISDEVASGRAFIADENTLIIDVNVQDVEESGGEVAVAGNNSFFLLVHESKARSQSDLHIGRKRSLSRMKGNGRYNLNAAGQKIRVKSKGNRVRHFFALQNDGNLTDSLTVRKYGKLRGVRAKVFRLTGGRQNVTAQVKKSGYTANMAPGEMVKFRVKSKFRSEDTRRAKVRLLSTSANDASRVDTVMAKLKRRN